MPGFYRETGGYKMSHTNSMAPFYSDIEKKKKKDARIKELTAEPAKIITTKIPKYDDIKTFKLPFKIKI